MNNSSPSMELSGIAIRDATGNSAITERSHISVEAPVAHDSVSDAAALLPGETEKHKDDDDTSTASQPKRQPPRESRGRGDRNRRSAEHRDLRDSWVAPEISHRSKKRRTKVSDITEWDTWIAPDLREEEERMERQAVAQVKEKQQQKELRKRNRRNRREARNTDSWVADSRDGDEGREWRTRRRSDESPRRRARIQGDSSKHSGRDTQHSESRPATHKGHSRERSVSRSFLSPRVRSRDPDCEKGQSLNISVADATV